MVRTLGCCKGKQWLQVRLAYVCLAAEVVRGRLLDKGRMRQILKLNRLRQILLSVECGWDDLGWIKVMLITALEVRTLLKLSYIMQIIAHHLFHRKLVIHPSIVALVGNLRKLFGFVIDFGSE